MQLNYKSIALPFEYPFTISNGRTKTHQPSLVVSLSLGNFTGFGEAPAIVYYNVTVEKMIEDLESKRAMVEKFALTDPARYWHYLHHLFPNNPFLVSALDMACWDLYGKMKGQPLYTLWNTSWQNTPVTDYTIGIDTIPKMLEKMQAKPWPVYKIKLGTPEDIEIMEALTAATTAVFRVDANAGWTTDEALLKIPILAKMVSNLLSNHLPKTIGKG